jgi:hypothetical protein
VGYREPVQKYGIPLTDLPSHCLDAVDAAERSRARTLVTRGGQAIAAIVPMTDLDLVDPPDPGAGGADPLLALCGACRDDDFVDALLVESTLTEDFDPTTTEEDLQATRVMEDLQATRATSRREIGRTLPGTGPRIPPVAVPEAPSPGSAARRPPRPRS